MNNPLAVISIATGMLVLFACIGLSHYANGDTWKQTFKEWIMLWGVIELLYAVVVWVVVSLKLIP